jgi:hypothetical protein
MAVPDAAYRSGGDKQPQLRPALSPTGVLSAAQPSAASGAERTGAKVTGIDPRRDNPQATSNCPGCPACKPPS